MSPTGDFNRPFAITRILLGGTPVKRLYDRRLPEKWRKS
jgi:hypothetical protein